MAKNTAPKNNANTAPAEDEWDEVESDLGEPWNPETKGENLTGVYCGSKLIKRPLTPDGKEDGHFLSHQIKTSEGKLWAIAAAMLDSRLDEVVIGTKVRLIFGGMEKAKRGMMKSFKVFVQKGADKRDVGKVVDARDTYKALKSGAATTPAEAEAEMF